jgi:hypothetical protein
MSSSKKFTCKRVLRQVFICLKMKTRRLHDSPLPLLNFSFLMRFIFSVWVTWTFSVVLHFLFVSLERFLLLKEFPDLRMVLLQKVPCRDDTSCDKTSQSKTSHARYILTSLYLHHFGTSIFTKRRFFANIPRSVVSTSYLIRHSCQDVQIVDTSIYCEERM